MAYQPIENYGVIGNMRTVALVGMDGSIDWFCCPNFDSPSVFAAILDEKKGGYFKIAPATTGLTQKQMYWPETNVLVTRFLSPDGVAEVMDFMPVGPGRGHYQLIRRVNVVRGTVAFRMECCPAFNYARDGHETQITAGGASFNSGQMGLLLATGVPVTHADKGVVADFTLHEGQTASFALHQRVPESHDPVPLSETSADELFKETVGYWRGWLSKCSYKGRWREMVERSALVLKLLTYEPTGSIVAAPTCSLPEEVGGERNWDYRYTWIRDSAFTVYGLIRIGFTDEASRFMAWIEDRCHELNPDGSLQIMYGIDGRHQLTEETLDHLEGYRGSSPVRIGNGRLSSVSARHLRRAYGCGLPLQQVRGTDLLRFLDPPSPAHQLGLRQLVEPRRGHLGNSRRKTAFCVLQSHVLGGNRPCPPSGGQTVLSRRSRTMAEGQGPNL